VVAAVTNDPYQRLELMSSGLFIACLSATMHTGRLFVSQRQKAFTRCTHQGRRLAYRGMTTMNSGSSCPPAVSVDVTRSNFAEHLPAISDALSRCSFFAFGE